MARQIQRQKLAQVQADFAFKIVEPPVVPDHYLTPVARIRAALAGFVVFALLAAYFVMREWLQGAARSLAALADSLGAPVPPPLVLGVAEMFAPENGQAAIPSGENGHGAPAAAANGQGAGALMCGIAGFVSTGYRTALERALRAMTAAQVHRGPDDGGIALLPAGSGGFAGLGSRRLAIIDRRWRGAAADDQPRRQLGRLQRRNLQFCRVAY